MLLYQPCNSFIWNNVVLFFFFDTLKVALDTIEELCYEMGLHKLEALDEYAIFVVTNRGEMTKMITHIQNLISYFL